MKKMISTLFLTSLLVACGYSTDNVKVADIYSGKKIALLDKMSDEDKDLLTKYMARKTVLFKKFEDGKKIFDSRDIGAGEFILDDESIPLTLGDKGVEVKIGDSVIQSSDGQTKINAKNSFVFVNNDEVSIIASDIGNNQRIETVVIRPNTETLKKLLGATTVKEAIAEQIEHDKNFQVFLEKRLAEKAKNEEDYKRQKYLSAKLRVLLVEKYKASDNELEFRFAFTNTSKKSVVAFRGIIEFYDNNDNKFYQMIIRDETEIKPRDLMNYDGDFVVDLEKPDEKKLMDINEDDITLKFVVTDILYDDGEFFGADDFKEKSEVLRRAKEIMSDSEVVEIIETLEELPVKKRIDRKDSKC